MKSTTMIKASNVPRSLAPAATVDPKERAFPGLIFFKNQLTDRPSHQSEGSRLSFRVARNKKNVKHRELKRMKLKDEFFREVFSGQSRRHRPAEKAGI
jgi:hypothetical protein